MPSEKLHKGRERTMNNAPSNRYGKNLIWVGSFAIAMAYVESAVVVYLRILYGIEDVVRDFIPYDPALGMVEVGRELATLVMLLTVGWVSGRSRQARLGFAFYAFGIWDIFYYLWLKVLIDWPDSLFEQDILFLLPLPWWGPVVAPVLTALLMMVAGGLMVIGDERGRRIMLSWREGAATAAGVTLMLYAFMADALAVLPANVETLNRLRPTEFNWPLYLLGLALAGSGVLKAMLPSSDERLPSKSSCDRS